MAYKPGCGVQTMPQRSTSMLDFFARGHDAPFLQEVRARGNPPIPMIENAHPPGRMSTPPVRELMISDTCGAPFRFRCDIGAGAFSGWADPKEFVVIPPNVPTYCQMHDPARMRFVGIPAGLARACLERAPDDPLDFGPLHTRTQADPLVSQALAALWQEMGRQDPAARLFVESMIAVLVVRLARLADQHQELASRRAGLAPHQSARVIEYMRGHLDHRVTLGDLAALTGLSPWHFARAFRETHGLPPHRYLTRLRLDRARDLLVRTPLSVTEIASATGYSSQQLARHFRRAFGVAPAAYRRIHTGSAA